MTGSLIQRPTAGTSKLIVILAGRWPGSQVRCPAPQALGAHEFARAGGELIQPHRGLLAGTVPDSDRPLFGLAAAEHGDQRDLAGDRRSPCAAAARPNSGRSLSGTVP